MITINKENAKAIAKYFEHEYKSLMVLKEDCETYIEWIKCPEKNPNKTQNEKILKDIVLESKDYKEQVEELNAFLKETNNQLEVITPLYESTKGWL